jgi:hypothetical protein
MYVRFTGNPHTRNKLLFVILTINQNYIPTLLNCLEFKLINFTFSYTLIGQLSLFNLETNKP